MDIVKIEVEQYMFHIVHSPSPRFALLAPMKPTFDIGTSHVTKGLAIAARPLILTKQFWWKQESRGAHLILQ